MFYYRGDTLFNLRYGHYKAHFYTWATPQAAIDIVSLHFPGCKYISRDFVLIILIHYLFYEVSTTSKVTALWRDRIINNHGDHNDININIDINMHINISIIININVN